MFGLIVLQGNPTTKILKNKSAQKGQIPRGHGQTTHVHATAAALPTQLSRAKYIYIKKPSLLHGTLISVMPRCPSAQINLRCFCPQFVDID